jgi:phosphoglycerate dehydrogenase-like enzyme
MSDHPKVVLSHTFPPETPGTVADLANLIRDARSEIDLHLAADRMDLIDQAVDATVLIEHGLPDELLDRTETLQWIQSLSAGTNRYDKERLDDEGIALTTVSGAHAPAIAQQTIGYLLMFERNLLQGLRQADHREWRRYQAGELTGRTVGIIGVGAIGSRVAELCASLGMDVLGLRNSSEKSDEHVDEMFGQAGLHTLLGRADYVVLACPLTSETEHLIDADALSTMRNGTKLINVARGQIVDQDALVANLQAGDLHGAALDVVDPEPLPNDSPLWDLSNVIITPHNAGGSQHFPERCAEIFLQYYEMFLSNGSKSLKQ